MKKLNEVRKGLVESGGRTSQDLGLGRIVGQILVYLYLQPKPCSLDELENELGLSKGAVSVAARQLEQLGLVQRVWIKGERKKFYRSTDNIGRTLQHGLLSLLRQKVSDFGNELELALNLLEAAKESQKEDTEFLIQRVTRASILQQRLDQLLANPLIHLLAITTEPEQA